MKEYPTISPVIVRELDIHAFDKIDGSQIRCEWTRKNGFCKFGSRKVLLDPKNEDLGEATRLIQETYEEGLTKIFRDNRWEMATCFFEYSGPNSFAGQHQAEPHSVILIDVNPYKKGIMVPREFVKTFEHLGIPKLLYWGRANATFEESVRASTLQGMTFEGVVCKGAHKGNHLTMFKIKSRAWLDKLRAFCGDNESLFRSLQ